MRLTSELALRRIKQVTPFVAQIQMTYRVHGKLRFYLS